MSEATPESVQGPVAIPYQAFKMHPLAVNQLETRAFGVLCECGTTAFSASGILLNIEVNPSCDVTVACGCGKSYSLNEQTKANEAAQAAMAALAAQQSVEAPAAAQA